MHRSTRGSREQVGRSVLNPAVKVVMLAKVWKRRALDDAFAAACVVWVKVAEDSIVCLAAHDFGSRPIVRKTRNNVMAESAPNDPLAPVVPQDSRHVSHQAPVRSSSC